MVHLLNTKYNWKFLSELNFKLLFSRQLYHFYKWIIRTLFQKRPFFFDSLQRIFIGPTGTLPVSHTATQNVPLQSKLSTPVGNDSVGHRVWSAFNLTFPSAITVTMSKSALISPFEVKNQFPPTQTPTQMLKIRFSMFIT